MPHKDKEVAREYHKEYNRAYMKEWRKNNLAVARKRDITWRTNNRLQTLIYATKQSAKKKGLEHDISVDDLEQVQICPLTGIEIDWSCSGRHLRNPSIDRIDPTKGYIKGNVEVMSCLGNTMKNNATPEQLLIFAKEIIRRYDSNFGHGDNLSETPKGG